MAEKQVEQGSYNRFEARPKRRKRDWKHQRNGMKLLKQKNNKSLTPRTIFLRSDKFPVDWVLCEDFSVRIFSFYRNRLVLILTLILFVILCSRLCSSHFCLVHSHSLTFQHRSLTHSFTLYVPTCSHLNTSSFYSRIKLTNRNRHDISLPLLFRSVFPFIHSLSHFFSSLSFAITHNTQQYTSSPAVS